MRLSSFIQFLQLHDYYQLLIIIRHDRIKLRTPLERLMREIRGAIETRRLDAYTAEFYGLLRAAAKA